MNYTRRRLIAAGAAAALPFPGKAQSEPEGEYAFLVLGDWGRGGSPIQKAVARRMEKVAQAIDGQFVVTVGDNFYQRGVRDERDAHWRVSFRDVYDLSIMKRWHPALGNHDHDGVAAAQVNFRGDGVWQMDGGYYEKTVDLPGGRRLDLFILDTSPIADRSYRRGRETYADDQKTWFDRRVGQSTADWKLVFGHHPIATSGARGRTYPPFADWLQPRLKDYGVQAYVAGHEHHLEHLRNRDDVAYIISGAGSENDRMRRRRHADHITGSEEPGFTAFRLRGDLLTVEFMSAGRDTPVGVAEITRSRTYPLRAAAA